MSPRANLVISVQVRVTEQDSGQLSLHLGESQIRSSFFSHDNYVPRWQRFLRASKKLSEEALNAVTPGGLAHLAPGHQPQPGSLSFPRGYPDTEMRRVQFFAPCLGPEVLPATAKPLVSGKAGRLMGS